MPTSDMVNDIPSSVLELMRLATELPDDVLVTYIDQGGVVRFVKTSRRINFPFVEGLTVEDPIVKQSVAYQAWQRQESTFQKVEAARFGFPYLIGAYAQFSKNHQFLGVISLILPSDGTDRLIILQEERDILNWLLRVARDVFGVVDPDQLWRQFRDIFLQLFEIKEGFVLVETNAELILHEHFGQGIVSHKEIEWLQEDAKIPHHAAEIDQEVFLMGEEWEMDRYELQLNARREILYLLREKGKPVHPLMSVVIDYYHLVREIVEQRASLEQLTFVDPLTEVWNRRALEDHMEHYFAMRNPVPAVFILFDLDHFKQLNDQSGHQLGDTALKAIARYARRTLRKGDWVARLGGDEFVLVLHETSGMNFLKTKMQQGAWWKKSPLRDYGLGMTMGLVEIPGEARNYQEAYRLADQRLYRGKQLGKGVLIYNENQPPIPLLVE